MSLEEIAKKIETMEIRGAGRIARAGATGIKDFALAYKDGEDVQKFLSELKKARDFMLATRPTAVSLRNAVFYTIKGVKEEKDVKSMINRIVKNADEFIQLSEKALEKIGKIAEKRIQSGNNIMTTCNSHAALAGIIRAHKNGKNIHVFATESRPKQQGFITVRELAAEGVPVTLICDSGVRHHMRKVDICFVGADTVCSNGAVINKIGTSQLALAAHEARVPFYVCAASFKFSQLTMSGELVEIEERDWSEIANPKDFPGVKFSNPVFDATPPEYISGIVTEFGIIPAYAAYDIIIKQFGGFVFDDEEE
ncbi:MAG: ribose 1,5-bisphosphate isomerase [Thermoplasmata archaeon]